MVSLKLPSLHREMTENEEKPEASSRPQLKSPIGIAAGATACVAAVPVVTTALGFTAGGITAGSTAAGT